MGRKGIAGVLSLGSWRENAFTADDLVFLADQIAKQVAIAVEKRAPGRSAKSPN